MARLRHWVVKLMPIMPREEATEELLLAADPCLKADVGDPRLRATLVWEMRRGKGGGGMVREESLGGSGAGADVLRAWAECSLKEFSQAWWVRFSGREMAVKSTRAGSVIVKVVLASAHLSNLKPAPTPLRPVQS
uniref:Uncharacterized protein n=1 Tax=Knipowitschia caucasica TaxID=637954 RepID=A0AAV2MQ51_KNICA